jgi:hypothetical protein
MVISTYLRMNHYLSSSGFTGGSSHCPLEEGEAVSSKQMDSTLLTAGKIDQKRLYSQVWFFGKMFIIKNPETF